METADENLLNILRSLTERGVRYKLVDGSLRFADPCEVLSESECAALSMCRERLTSVYLRYREAAAERVEDHAPALLHRSCYTVGGKCSSYTSAQFHALMLSQIKPNRGCGDCDLFAVEVRAAIARRKREKVEERERATERANRFFVEASEREEEE